jgi:hypothetical protein
VINKNVRQRKKSRMNNFLSKMYLKIGDKRYNTTMDGIYHSQKIPPNQKPMVEYL